MTRPELLATSLDMSKRLAEVLGKDVETYFVWAVCIDIGTGEKRWELRMKKPAGTLQPSCQIPAYTVTELNGLCGYFGMPIAGPDTVAERVLDEIEWPETITPEQARANLREWQKGG